ncbi:MAG: dephospho-CoA kinase [Candidatus Omnitrophica bacterium]|nr:dephospho-CoA kinase [Candidatus Omnitrophota bacterium]
MIVIGITGGLGTGKSTVARMFGDLGAVVLDADRIAHEVMEPKKLAWRAIIRAFGEDVLNEDNTVNRRWLAARVFRDPEARRELEAIVHPHVLKHIKQRLHRLRRRGRACLPRRPGGKRAPRRQVKAVVLDVPLLVETGSQKLVDALVVVTAPPDVQRQRLIARGMSEGDAAGRIAAQWQLTVKEDLADYVVENGNGLDQTRRQVSTIWNRLLAAKRARA